MATVVSGVTVSAPGVSASELVSVSVTEGGDKPLAYSGDYSPNGGTATVVSLGGGGSPGKYGALTVTGVGISINVPRVYVESVDTSASVGDVVRYTTTMRIIKQ
jgi:hypothetical protein